MKLHVNKCPFFHITFQSTKIHNYLMERGERLDKTEETDYISLFLLQMLSSVRLPSNSTHLYCEECDTISNVEEHSDHECIHDIFLKMWFKAKL